MPTAYLASRRGRGNTGGGGRGGGGPRLLVLDTEIADGAGDGALGLAEAWEMICSLPLLPRDGGAEEVDPWDNFRTIHLPTPVRRTHRTSPRRRRIPSGRGVITHKVEIPCLCLPQVPLPLVRSTHCQGLGIVLLSTRRLGGAGTAPPPIPCVAVQGIADRIADFFALLLPFWLRLPGFFLIVLKSAPPPAPPKGTIIPSGPQPHCAVRSLATRTSVCCYS